MTIIRDVRDVPFLAGPRSSRSWKLALGSCILMILLIPIGWGDLQHDAPMYAWFSKRVAATGEWTSLYFDWAGEHPYFNKPPLMLWITAALMRVLGQTITVARIVPAMGFLVAAVAFYRLLQRQFSSAFAATAACIFLINPEILANYLEVRMDGGMLAAMMIASLGMLHLAESASEGDHRAAGGYALIGLALGLGLLWRGGIVLLCLPVLVLFLAGLRQWRTLLSWRGWLILLGISAGVALPWVLWQTHRWGDAFGQTIRYDAIAQHAMQEHTVSQLLLYYPQRFVEGFALWLIPLAGGLFVLWRRRGRWTNLELLAVLWIVVTLIAIHCTTLRATRYLLPMCPWLALIAALGLWRNIARVRGWWSTWGAVVLPLLALAIAGGTLAMALNGKGPASVNDPELIRSGMLIAREIGHDRATVPPQRPVVWLAGDDRRPQRLCAIQFHTGLHVYPLPEAPERGGIRPGDYLVRYLPMSQSEADMATRVLQRIDAGKRMQIDRIE